MTLTGSIPSDPEQRSFADLALAGDWPPRDDATLRSRSNAPAPSRDAHSLRSTEGRPELVTGALVGERYRLVGKVGAGGMGEVWCATHERLHIQVAVKVLLSSALRVPEMVMRFEREAILLGRVRDDHVPRAIDFFVDDVYGPVLVTEFVEGKSLADALAAAVSIEQAIDLGLDLASGISALHRADVVHRDIKPGNVILQPLSDGRTRAVIVDFGVSRLLHEPAAVAGEAADITTVDAVMGTLEYMAPEQILHCARVTAAADLYALGALLFRAVTGEHVFGATSDRLELARTKLTCEAPPLPTSRHDAVSRGLSAILARALERNPARRYQSAEELLADFSDLCNRKDPITATTPSANAASCTPPLARALPVRRRGSAVAAILIAVLLAIAVCAGPARALGVASRATLFEPSPVVAIH